MSKALKLLPDPQPKKWYHEGLRFKCTECGDCCTGAPGYIWMNEEEIFSIAEYLKLSLDEFAKRYLRLVDGKFSLIEDSKNYDCVFLKDKKCTVYPVRPKQCRTFPWWPNNLKTPQHWKEAAKYCEGINLEAETVDFETIEEELQKNEKDFQ
jgi:Fe-S-cluster containining protein